uniref:fimbria/pilus outer membrane usher protein n=1 Tax=Microbulbifer agarilyticus TaxID=260552 RepID=UPI000255AA5F|nr:fimbria/pilus outer membrane usher protein [Microbulbifer agarilyticus]
MKSLFPAGSLTPLLSALALALPFTGQAQAETDTQTHQGPSVTQTAAASETTLEVRPAPVQTPVPTPDFQISLPASVNGISAGTLLTAIAGSDPVSFDRTQLETFAREHFDPQVVAQIFALDAESNTESDIRIEVLRELGIDVVFDLSRLSLEFNLLDDQRLAQTLAVREYTLDYDALDGVDLPGRSAYLNFSLTPEYRWQDDNQLQKREAMQTEIDGALVLMESPRVILEGAARYDSAFQDSRWQRGDVRLLHDDISRAIRYSLGDIFYRATDFQSSPQLLGVSVERAYQDIQPLRNITPTGSRTVAVNQRSSVDVYVNGLFQRTLQVDPGRYQLSDFAFNTGVNEVELVITDASGEQRRVNFSLFADPAQLSQGLSEFSVNLGYQRQTSPEGELDYDYDLPLLSGFYRYGISDNLTLGASLQGTRDAQIVGAETTLATPAGIFSSNLSQSDSDVYGRGYASSLRWSFDFFPGKAFGIEQFRPHELDVVAVNRSDNFYSLAQGAPTERYGKEWRARYSAPTLFNTYVSASLRYAEPFSASAPEERAASIDFSRRFGALSTTLRIERETGVENDNRMVMRFSLPIGRRSLSSAQWDTQRDLGEVTWGRFARDQVDDWSGGFAVRSELDNYRADADVTYHGNRFIAGADHSFTEFSDPALSSAHVTRGRFATSLAYADGYTAFGRPIEDAFVMVRRHPTLADTRILIDDRDGGATAIADDWGPAIVPRVESYLPRRVLWQAEEPPHGYDVGDIEASALPFYRSGVTYTVGSDASITAMGVALDHRGQPVPMAVGYIYPRDGREFAPVSTFTNRQGRFVAQALAPGAYVLKFPALGDMQIPFNIEETAVGVTELGNVQEQTKL